MIKSSLRGALFTLRFFENLKIAGRLEWNSSDVKENSGKPDEFNSEKKYLAKLV